MNTSTASSFEPSRHRRYVLGVMMVAYLVQYLDRQLPAILLPSIRRDLALSDTQLGFITGLAFALFYAVMGVPLGRMADRFTRRTILSVCIAAWSVMTAVTGTATTFMTMAVARFGVGIGEAGLTPCAHSLISDYYPPKGRATALGIYNLGVPLGSLVAFMAAGWLDKVVGWRVAFMIIGLPGLLLALVVRFTVREPPRGGADHIADPGKLPPLKDVFNTLRLIPSYRYALLGATFAGLAYTATTQWASSYLARSFGMTPAEVGPWLAPAIGLGGGLGTFLGGYLADVLRERDVRWTTWVPGTGLGIVVIPALFAYLAGSSGAAIALLSFPLVLCPMNLAPFSAILQGLAPLRMRGSFPAISLLISVTIGLGFGPQMVGVVSDALSTSYGEESLRYALAIVVPAAALLSAMFFFLASRTIGQDLAAAKSS